MDYKVPETGCFTLRQCRQLLNLTQRQAAELLEISEDKLSNFERQVSFPNVPMIKKIERLYGIPYNRIIFMPDDCG